MSADHGRLPFFDKDTLPLKPLAVSSGVRVVPGGSSVRDGAYFGRGVICMPPMYVNIGAYVGDETLVDSHALVGSCAQIGSRVHLSAAAQIGGVLEPVGALPVIIEDDVLVGGNCGVYEGAIVKRRAVLASGTILTRSTPLYDLPNGRIIEPEEGQPLVVPEGAVVVPGSRQINTGRAREWGLSVATPDHRQVPRREDFGQDGPRSMDSLATVAFARQLIDIDSTTGKEQAAGAWLAAQLEALGYTRRTAAGRGRPVQRLRDARSSARGAVDALRLRAAVLSERRARRRALRPRRVRREGDPRRAAGGRRAAPRGRRAAHRPAVRRRRRAGERRGGRGQREGSGLRVSDQRRAHRQPARDGDARQSPHPADGAAAAPRTRPRPNTASRRSTSCSTR